MVPALLAAALRRSEAWVALPLAVVLLGGCGKKASVVIPGQTENTFEAIQAHILTPSCGFASCHGSAAPAVDLDLVAGDVCAQLREAESCVAAGRRMVVPGSSGDSFFLQKLTGHDLGAPDGSCGVATNRRMPYGGEALSDDKIRMVRAWIDDGALCPGDLGGTEPPDEPMDTAVAVSQLMVMDQRLLVGERTRVRVMLEAAAPAGGQLVALDIADREALGAPAAVLVPEGGREAEAEVVAKRPVAPTTLRATAGGRSAEATLTVKGLALVEIFGRPSSGLPDRLQWVKLRNVGRAPIDMTGYVVAAGRARWGDTVFKLSGVVAPGACAVVGGPETGPPNADPTLTVAADFAPDMPTDLGPGLGNAGFGLFAASAIGADGQAATLPLDAVAIGAGSTSSRLLSPEGAPLEVSLTEPAQGASAALTAGGWRAQPPTPHACP